MTPTVDHLLIGFRLDDVLVRRWKPLGSSKLHPTNATCTWGEIEVDWLVWVTHGLSER